jgi:DNA processing protein
MREAERELRHCHQHGLSILCSTDGRYPRLLKETPDYPAVLYVRGRVEALAGRMISFVGTRKISAYGQRMCDELVRGVHELVPDAVIVSGLAFGVDGAAHRAALSCGAKTVAVVANPLPQVTPASHENLAADIVAHGGAIVSELSSQVKQNGRFYIPRNRIIAALSAGTVVVESGESGGSLSTAAFADGYSRSVMAVPGRASDSGSRGCNLLIRNRKAQLVLSGRDVVSELMWELGVEEPAEHAQAESPLSEAEQRFLEYFDSDPLTIDQLQLRSGMSLGDLSYMLMCLELSGAIQPLAGKRYEKII